VESCGTPHEVFSDKKVIDLFGIGVLNPGENSVK